MISATSNNMNMSNIDIMIGTFDTNYHDAIISYTRARHTLNIVRQA